MKVFLGRYPKNPNSERKVNIRIDKWDTWSMDHTLALIILPMLKQLQATKHGAPGSMPAFNQTSETFWPQQCLEFYKEDDTPAWDEGHKQWTEIMDKMIWSFEQLLDENWDEQYWIEKGEYDWEDMMRPFEKGEVTRELKCKKEAIVDWAGREAHAKRIQEGLELFGKHFQDLWD